MWLFLKLVVSDVYHIDLFRNISSFVWQYLERNPTEFGVTYFQINLPRPVQQDRCYAAFEVCPIVTGDNHLQANMIKLHISHRSKYV